MEFVGSLGRIYGGECDKILYPMRVLGCAVEYVGIYVQTLSCADCKMSLRRETEVLGVGNVHECGEMEVLGVRNVYDCGKMEVLEVGNVHDCGEMEVLGVGNVHDCGEMEVLGVRNVHDCGKMKVLIVGNVHDCGETEVWNEGNVCKSTNAEMLCRIMLISFGVFAVQIRGKHLSLQKIISIMREHVFQIIVIIISNVIFTRCIIWVQPARAVCIHFFASLMMYIGNLYYLCTDSRFAFHIDERKFMEK